MRLHVVRFALNPTGDLNPLPLISIIRGQQLRRVVGKALVWLLGREGRHRGPLEALLLRGHQLHPGARRAPDERPHPAGAAGQHRHPGRIATGGVRDGDLLCDGGTFNNFPVDVMRARRGVGTVIGVDLSQTIARKLPLEQMPSWWQLALDRLRPRRRRRYRLPSLPAYLMNVTILYSSSRRAQARADADWVFNPPLFKVGMLQWSRLEGHRSPGPCACRPGAGTHRERTARALASPGARSARLTFACGCWRRQQPGSDASQASHAVSSGFRMARPSIRARARSRKQCPGPG
jgi:NTE family protein